MLFDFNPKRVTIREKVAATGQESSRILNVFTSTKTALMQNNEEIEEIDEEINQEMSRLQEDKDSLAYQATNNNKIIKKINDFLS